MYLYQEAVINNLVIEMFSFTHIFLFAQINYCYNLSKYINTFAFCIVLK